MYTRDITLIACCFNQVILKKQTLKRNDVRKFEFKTYKFFFLFQSQQSKSTVNSQHGSRQHVKLDQDESGLCQVGSWLRLGRIESTQPKSLSNPLDLSLLTQKRSSLSPNSSNVSQHYSRRNLVKQSKQKGLLA